MGKVNTNISFDKDFLNKLKNDSNACVQVHRRIYHLALHPFHLTDLSSSIRGILNEKIAKYDKTIDGILLGYQNIKLMDSAGGINFDSCFIHTNIEADFYIFKPAIGQILNGVVNKKSKDHVGCLVHKTFNVSLPKPEDTEKWIGHSTHLGQEIQFEILSTDLDGKLPYIKGKILSILSDDSGFSTCEEPNHKQNTHTKFTDSDTEIPYETEKRKRKRGSSPSLDSSKISGKKMKYDNVNQEHNDETPKTHKKHKHKERKNKVTYEDDSTQQLNCDNELLDVGNAHTDNVKTKKKHKHKKSKVDKTENNIEEDFNNAEKNRRKVRYSGELENNQLDSSNEAVKQKKKKKKHKHSTETEAEDNLSSLLFKDNNSETPKRKRKKEKHRMELEIHTYEEDEKEPYFAEDHGNKSESQSRTHVKKKKKKLSND